MTKFKTKVSLNLFIGFPLYCFKVGFGMAEIVEKLRSMFRPYNSKPIIQYIFNCEKQLKKRRCHFVC